MLYRFLIALLCAVPVAAADRPNIILIMSDDMGYSDLGCFGGEVRTPNLDKLAGEGLRFTQFYNTGRCCPTRASLVTGLHPHQAGIGHMTESPKNRDNGDFGTPAYRGRLTLGLPTVADALGDAGYRTMISGKWHLGLFEREYWPLQRGFDRFYGILTGASLFFNPGGDRGLTLDNERVAPEPTREGERYYTTDAFTDWGIRFIEEAEALDDDQPFFLYLAYTAPHWPIQAPAADVARYEGRYDAGYEALRAERHARMLEMGLIDEGWGMPELDGPAWDSLSPERQANASALMEVYAAMIDRMDQNIGRLVDALERMGERENTLIIFINDNGACAEGGVHGSDGKHDPKTYEGWGTTVGVMWAQAQNTPYREYKHWIHEGGIATPCIVNWPAGIPEADHGAIRLQPGYLPDIMPTLLELANAEDKPKTEGISLVPMIVDNTPATNRPMFWEHEGNAAVRVGDWKLVRMHAGGSKWELYHLADDRTETNNLIDAEPARAAALTTLWDNWAERVGVLPWSNPRQMREEGRARNQAREQE